jgi:hypothetical protein
MIFFLLVFCTSPTNVLAVATSVWTAVVRYISYCGTQLPFCEERCLCLNIGHICPNTTDRLVITTSFNVQLSQLSFMKFLLCVSSQPCSWGRKSIEMKRQVFWLTIEQTVFPTWWCEELRWQGNYRMSLILPNVSDFVDVCSKKNGLQLQVQLRFSTWFPRTRWRNVVSFTNSLQKYMIYFNMQNIMGSFLIKCSICLFCLP